MLTSSRAPSTARAPGRPATAASSTPARAPASSSRPGSGTRAPAGVPARPCRSHGATTTPGRPTSTRATKLAQEHVLAAWAEAHGVRAVGAAPAERLRPRPVADQHLHRGRSPFFAGVASAGEPIDVYEDGDDRPRLRLRRRRRHRADRGRRRRPPRRAPSTSASGDAMTILDAARAGRRAARRARAEGLRPLPPRRRPRRLVHSLDGAPARAGLPARVEPAARARRAARRGSTPAASA